MKNTITSIPPRDDLTVCFAHIAYPMDDVFEKRNTGINHFQVRTQKDLNDRIEDLDVLVVSGLWGNHLVEFSRRLRFIQSIGAGYDQFPLDELRVRGIRLASASGVNLNAVSEHAFSLILAFSRQIHIGRDNQRARFWRGMVPDIHSREDELSGKTLGIIGLGKIGSRVATLAKAFGMHVIATKRNPATAEGPADEIYPPDRLQDLLSRSDFVVLNCSLTEETKGIIDCEAFAKMKPSAYLVNVARGACIDEPALLEALRSGEIAGAAIDHFWEDPLPENSPFWDMDNMIITPHTGGETRMYEENVIDILLENLSRLWEGKNPLVNQVV